MADEKKPVTKTAAEKQAINAQRKAEAEKAAQAKQPAGAKPADKAPAKPAEKPQAKAPPKKPGLWHPIELVKDVNDRLQLCGAKFSPCGKFVLGGSMVGSVLRVDATTDDFAPLKDFTGHGGYVSGMAFGPNGSNLVYTSDSWGRLSAWDYTAAEPKAKWTVADAHSKWLRSVAVTADGKTLATCGLDNAVRLWDAATGKKLADLAGHTWDVLDVAFSPDGKTLVSGDLSGVVKTWDVATKKHVRDIDAKALFLSDRLQDIGGARVLRFTPDGKTLVVAGTLPKSGGNVQGTAVVRSYDPATGKQTKEFKLDTGAIYVFDVAFHPDGYWLIVASGNPGTGQMVLLRPTEEKAFYTSTKVANLHGAAFSPLNPRRFIVTAINPNNSGNGAVKNKESAEYVSNYSPIKVFELPEKFEPAA